MDALDGRFQRRLRELRQARNLTQERASALAQISEKHYQALEGGSSPNPTWSTLKRLAGAFQVSVGELVGFDAPSRRARGRPRRALP